jgi:hypothetical protein
VLRFAVEIHCGNATTWRFHATQRECNGPACGEQHGRGRSGFGQSGGFVAAMAQAPTRFMGLFTATPSQTSSSATPTFLPTCLREDGAPVGATTSLSPTHGGPSPESEFRCWGRALRAS